MRENRRFGKTVLLLHISDIAKSICMIGIASAIGFVFSGLGMSESNIIMVYILGVLLTSVITTYQVYGLISSLINVVVFNFLFTEPRYTLLAYDKDYPLTFITMFIAAFLTGSLAIRLKRQTEEAARAAYKTGILLDTNQLLERVREREGIVGVTTTQLIKLLDRDIAVYMLEGENLSVPRFFPSNGDALCSKYISAREKEAAARAWKSNQYTGATTGICPDADYLYLPVRTETDVYGVVGIAIGNNPLDSFEKSILLSVLGECALALENEKNVREKAEAALIAQKEQLRANLLRSISHDLRTPLTSISGNASNLMSNGERFDADTKQQLYMDIYDDSMWLINLVENLLSVTRIEEGRATMHFSTELLDEMITEALQHVGKGKEAHKIIFRPADEIILVRADARLIMQVIINIVDNAMKYTKAGSEIKIETHKSDTHAVVSVTDNGQGIPDDMKPFVFDMFYIGSQSIADNRRSVGLGLYLCKSIITAHEGTIEVSDNSPQGAVFTFMLPVEEVELHE